MPKITIDRDIFVATCTTEEICIWIRDDNVLWAQLSNVVLSANMQKEYFARRKRYREEDAKWMANRIRNITITEKCDETNSITRSKWNEKNRKFTYELRFSVQSQIITLYFLALSRLRARWNFRQFLARTLPTILFCHASTRLVRPSVFLYCWLLNILYADVCLWLRWNEYPQYTAFNRLVSWIIHHHESMAKIQPLR